jgi:hypothetical protein
MLQRGANPIPLLRVPGVARHVQRQPLLRAGPLGVINSRHNWMLGRIYSRNQ